jgi:hypothetical protein
VIQDSIIPLVSLLSSGIPKVLNSSVSTNECKLWMALKSEVSISLNFNLLLKSSIFLLEALKFMFVL